MISGKAEDATKQKSHPKRTWIRYLLYFVFVLVALGPIGYVSLVFICNLEIPDFNFSADIVSYFGEPDYSVYKILIDAEELVRASARLAARVGRSWTNVSYQCHGKDCQLKGLNYEVGAERRIVCDPNSDGSGEVKVMRFLFDFQDGQFTVETFSGPGGWVIMDRQFQDIPLTIDEVFEMVMDTASGPVFDHQSDMQVNISISDNDWNIQIKNLTIEEEFVYEIPFDSVARTSK